VINNAFNTFLGNDLYKLMLDPYMQYTCGYWRNANNLNQAQLDKLKLISEKLKLKPGMKVLELGCGFGGLAKYMAENYGVSVTGCSISKEQTAIGKELCKGLPVEFLICDYMDLKADHEYDRIVGVGFMEHVGTFNYRNLFKLAEKALKDDGILVLHCMGVNSTTIGQSEKWSAKNLFPNGGFIKLEQLITCAEDYFMVEDLQNIGADYYKTLRAWEDNFDKGWPQLQPKYGDKFYKMWKLYLHYAQGLLSSRQVNVYQTVYTKKGIIGGYQAPR